MSHLHFHLQVAFASDSTNKWKAKQLGPSKHSLDFIVGLAFKGIQINIHDPFYKISMDNILPVVPATVQMHVVYPVLV